MIWLRSFAGVALILMGACGKEALPPRFDVSTTQQIAASSNAFGVELHDELGDQSGNLVWSPLSVHAALTLMLSGAKGETAQEIADALHFDAEDSQALKSAGAWIQWLSEDSDDGPELSITNALWINDRWKAREEFIATAKRDFGAAVRNLGFSGGADEAVGTINDWVADQTNDRIDDLLPPGSIDSAMRFVLTNAVYFKGEWASPFERQYTRPESFHVSADQTQWVPMMTQLGVFGYRETEQGQVVVLPYVDSNLAMMLMLPREGVALAEVERALIASAAAGDIREVPQQRIWLEVPRFRMDTAIDLTDPLRAMGIQAAFADAADFSRIAGGEPLFITGVFQQAMIDADESGTEAAAATGLPAPAPDLGPLPRFRADRPFLFFIVDQPSGAILFMGRVVNPAG